MASYLTLIKPSISQIPTILYSISWQLVTSLTSCYTSIPPGHSSKLTPFQPVSFLLQPATHFICSSLQPGPPYFFPPPGRLFHVVIHVGRSPASFGSFLKPPLICTSQYTPCVLFIYCAYILSPYHHAMKERKFALFFATVFTCL